MGRTLFENLAGSRRFSWWSQWFQLNCGNKRACLQKVHGQIMAGRIRCLKPHVWWVFYRWKHRPLLTLWWALIDMWWTQTIQDGYGTVVLRQTYDRNRVEVRAMQFRRLQAISSEHNVTLSWGRESKSIRTSDFTYSPSEWSQGCSFGF